MRENEERETARAVARERREGRLAWIQYCAAAAGILLVGAWLAAWVHGEFSSRRDIDRFEEAREKRLVVRPIESVADVGGEPVATALWAPERVEGYQESLFHDFDIPLAVMRVPAVGIEVPVLPGTDELTLNRGAGWIEGTAAPGGDGNFAVAGHRDGFFRGLKDIQQGDEIRVETLDAGFTYVIDNLVVVDPSDVSVLEPRAEPSVTLVTCYPFYFVGSAPQRFIVQASLRESKPAGVSFNSAD